MIDHGNEFSKKHNEAAEFNRNAWDAIAISPRQWFVPVDADQIASARNGNLAIKVTATRNLPAAWLGNVTGKQILCLAAGGGHQGPLLAAAGGQVTVADISNEQLKIDADVAAQHNLSLETVQCDMRDLACLAGRTRFDLVLNPCSLNFCPDVRVVWQQIASIIQPDGVLVTGFIQPVNYLFDANEMLHGRFVVANSIPYAESPPVNENHDPTLPPVPVEFGHSLSDLIGGQLDAGFQITDFLEDRWGAGDALSDKIAVFAATRAIFKGN